MLLVLVHVLVTLMVVLLEVAHYTPGKKKGSTFKVLKYLTMKL